MKFLADEATKKENMCMTVKNFLIENFLFGQEKLLIDEDDSLLGAGIIDSTGILELIHFLEHTYNMHVEDNEIIPVNLDSLSNIICFIEKKQNSATRSK